jgi:hypothetical protein
MRSRLESYSTSSFPRVLRNDHTIDARLAEKQRIVDSVVPPEDLRKIGLQVVVVKTANDPELLTRFLTHIKNDLQTTNTESPVCIGVVDDSTKDVPSSEMLKVIQESGIKNVGYVRIKGQDNSTLIGRIQQKLSQSMGHEPHFRQKGARLALHYLLSERGQIGDVDTALRNLTKEEESRDLFAHMGGGPMAMTNVAALLGAYMMGLRGVSPSHALFTHHDDDLVYQTLDHDASGVPRIGRHDFFREREILFGDPQTAFSAGRYVGVSGSPLFLLRSVLEIANGVLANDVNLVSHRAPSPYPIFDERTGKFQSMTTAEIKHMLPEIISRFLSRIPNTGFVTNESYDGQSGNHTIFFDQGNFTMIGDLARRIATATGGLMEYTLPPLLKSLYRDTEINRLIRPEEGLLHLRVARPRGGEYYKGNIIAGSIQPYIQEQIAIELILHTDPELAVLVQQAFGDAGITSELLVRQTPMFCARRQRYIDSIIALHTVLKMRLDQIIQYHPEDLFLAEGLGNLLELSSPAMMQYMQQVLDGVAQDTNFLQCTRKSIRRYLKAASYWPNIFDAAYQLGAEDA